MADTKVCRLFTWAIAMLVLSLAGTLVATVAHDELTAALASGLQANYVLQSPDSPAYAPWANSSDPDAGLVISSYYIYHVANAAAVIAGDNGTVVRPNVTEVGPLRYTYNNMKYNVTWDDDPDVAGDIVQFKQYQYYTALDDATLALEETVVTTVNLALVSALNNPAAAWLIANDDRLTAWRDPAAMCINRTAREVLWGVQQDPFLIVLNEVLNGTGLSFPMGVPGLQNNDSSLAMSLATHSPVRMYTGVRTPDLMMQYTDWDGAPTMLCCAQGPCGDSTSGGGTPTPAWATDDANRIAGSEGSQFKVGVSPADILTVSTYDFGIYRHWPLTSSDGDTYQVDKITLQRFTIPLSVLANATTSPLDGAPYYSNGPGGLLNQSACEGGAPIFLSKPRFLDGDPSLAAALLDFPPPDRSQHDTWLGVEPNTGSTFDFHWRVGVNIFLQPITVARLFQPDLVFFPAIAPVYHPLMWGGQDSTIEDGQAADFRSQVYLAVTVITAVRWGGVALAAAAGATALALLVAALCIRRRRTIREKAVLAGSIQDLGASASMALGGGDDIASLHPDDYALLPA